MSQLGNIKLINIILPVAMYSYVFLSFLCMQEDSEFMDTVYQMEIDSYKTSKEKFADKVKKNEEVVKKLEKREQYEGES